MSRASGVPGSPQQNRNNLPDLTLSDKTLLPHAIKGLGNIERERQRDHSVLTTGF